ncbi:nuclear transport factor 2 family protein [Chromatiaceae bacterium AAb-1]|nr:nuclear transport factor 2 family protein [Chromatiaceae bacterium AAb-1]
MLKKLFQCIDEKDTVAFIDFLAPDGVFRFGNQPAVSGKEHITGYITAFFDSIRAIKHDVVDSWQIDNTIICQGFVTYTYHDGNTLTVPFANILKCSGNKIHEYLIFVDNKL